MDVYAIMQPDSVPIGDSIATFLVIFFSILVPIFLLSYVIIRKISIKKRLLLTSVISIFFEVLLFVYQWFRFKDVIY